VPDVSHPNGAGPETRDDGGLPLAEAEPLPADDLDDLDDPGAADDLGDLEDLDELDEVVVERAVLNASAEGREIAAGFVTLFGRFISEDVRPLLRDVAADGREPQLLVNGLAELMRDVAAAIEMPVGEGRTDG
jgi:hypothetical protein